jgi:hypothetical protein
MENESDLLVIFERTQEYRVSVALYVLTEGAKK